MHEKVIIDTDIGGDIDDSLALAYLLHASNASVLGITTVTGQPEIRAELCRMMIKIAGKRIPVYAGSAHPLCIGAEHQPICQMADLVSDNQQEHKERSTNAIDYMIEQVRKYPGEITLLAIAPLTNVALAIRKDPEFSMNLKRLVIMGGQANQGDISIDQSEWNFYCDMDAAQIVLEAQYREFVIFPSDFTFKIHSDKSYLFQNLYGEFKNILSIMGNNWFSRGYDGFHYHDPLAAVYCLHPELFITEKGQMNIIRKNESIQTSWKIDNQSFESVAKDVNRIAFLKELYRVINGKSEDD